MTINCTNIQDLFTSYADHELDAETVVRFDSHIASCPGCAREWICFKTTLQWCADVDPVPVPADFLTGIHEKLEAGGWFARACRWLQESLPTMSLPAAAATVAVALTAMVFFKAMPLNRTGPASPFDTKKEVAAVSPARENPMDFSAVKLATTGNRRQGPAMPLVQLGDAGDILRPFSSRAGFYPDMLRVNGTDVIYRLNSPISLMRIGSYGPVFDRRLNVLTNPDILVVVRAAGSQTRDVLFNQLINEMGARVTADNHNRLFISLNHDELPQLRRLLKDHRVNYSPPGVESMDPGNPRKDLLVSVQVQ